MYTVAPTLHSDVDNYSAVVNSPVQMSCDAHGFPPPVITWYKDGVENVTWSTGGHVLANGALRIDRVAVNDSGVYECRAVNNAGAASRRVMLSVHGLSSNVLLL